MVTRKNAGLALLALLGLITVAGCGKSGTEGGGAEGGTVGSTGAASNASTVSTIESKIKADTDLAGTDIKVKAEGATISLEGTVNSVAQKDKAEKIVTDTQKELKQQVGVLNNLNIKEGGAGGGSGGK
jgi:hypothetical protein